jgi:hypothetical protein
VGKLGWAAGCVGGGAKWGAKGAEMGGGGPGAVVGGLIGGAYGCLFEPDKKAGEVFERQVRKLEAFWDDTARKGKNLWRQSGNVVKDIGSFFGVGGGSKKKPSVKRPSLDDGIGLMIHHLQGRVAQGLGARVEGQWRWEVEQPDGRWMMITSHPARWPLHPSNLAALYGPAAATWDADAVYHMIAVLFRKTPAEWNPALRFSMAYKRVGDFLVQADAKDRIDDWPLFDAEFEREEMRRRLLSEMGGGEDAPDGNVKGSAASLEGGKAHLALGFVEGGKAHLALGFVAALLGGAALATGGTNHFKEVLG